MYNGCEFETLSYNGKRNDDKLEIGISSMSRSANGALIIEEGDLKHMRVIADLCIVPIGVGVSLSKYVAACEGVIEASGLKSVLHANGTNVEGEWDQVFEVLRKCHDTVHQMGAPRIFTTIKMGTRVDRDQRMEDKIESVNVKR